MINAAFCTLLTNPSYLAGAVVLDKCLKNVNSQYPLLVLVASSLSKEAIDFLHRMDIQTKQIELLTPNEDNWNSSTTDSRFKDVWTKLRLVTPLTKDFVNLLNL